MPSARLAGGCCDFAIAEHGVPPPSPEQGCALILRRSQRLIPADGDFFPNFPESARIDADGRATYPVEDHADYDHGLVAVGVALCRSDSGAHHVTVSVRGADDHDYYGYFRYTDGESATAAYESWIGWQSHLSLIGRDEHMGS